MGWDLTLPHTLHMEGSTLQFHRCAPVGDSRHFHSPETKYSFSVTPTGFLEVAAILYLLLQFIITAFVLY